MNDLKVFRWTGAFGAAVFVLVLMEFPLWGVGSAPPTSSLATCWDGWCLSNLK
jgi:hypothetical protein